MAACVIRIDIHVWGGKDGLLASFLAKTSHHGQRELPTWSNVSSNSSRPSFTFFNVFSISVCNFRNVPILNIGIQNDKNLPFTISFESDRVTLDKSPSHHVSDTQNILKNLQPMRKWNDQSTLTATYAAKKWTWRWCLYENTPFLNPRAKHSQIKHIFKRL